MAITSLNSNEDDNLLAALEKLPDVAPPTSSTEDDFLLSELEKLPDVKPPQPEVQKQANQIPFINNEMGPRQPLPGETQPSKTLGTKVSEAASGLKEYSSQVADLKGTEFISSFGKQLPSKVAGVTSEIAQMVPRAGAAVGTAVESLGKGETLKSTWENVKNAWESQPLANKVRAVTEELQKTYLQGVGVTGTKADILADPAAGLAADIVTIEIPADLGATAALNAAKKVYTTLKKTGITTPESARKVGDILKGTAEPSGIEAQAAAEVEKVIKAPPTDVANMPKVSVEGAVEKIPESGKMPEISGNGLKEENNTIRSVEDLGAAKRIDIPETEWPIFGGKKFAPNLIDRLTNIPAQSVGKTLEHTTPDNVWTLSADFDKAKAINEQISHAAFDDVLKKFGVIFKEFFPDKVIARSGGEEFFARLGTDLSDIDKQRAADMLNAVHDRIKVKWTDSKGVVHEEPVTMSMGIGKGNVSEGDIRALASDKAAMKSKQTGRNKLTIDYGDGTGEEFLGPTVARKGYVSDFAKKQTKENINELMATGDLDPTTGKTILDALGAEEATAQSGLRADVGEALQGKPGAGPRAPELAQTPTGGLTESISIPPPKALEQAPVPPLPGLPKATTVPKIEPTIPEAATSKIEQPLKPAPTTSFTGEKPRSVSLNMQKHGLWQGEPATYKVKSEKETASRVDELIKDKGIEHVHDFVMNGSLPSSEKVVASSRIVVHYDNEISRLKAQIEGAAAGEKAALEQQLEGIKTRSRRVAQKLAEDATDAGQGIQAFKQVYNFFSDENAKAYLERLVNIGKKNLKEKPLTEGEIEAGTDIAKSIKDVDTVKKEITDINPIIDKIRRNEKLSEEEIGKLISYKQTIKGTIGKVEKTAKPRIKVLKGADAILASGHESLDAAQKSILDRIKVRRASAVEQVKVLRGEKPGITELRAGFTPKDIKLAAEDIADYTKLGAIVFAKYGVLKPAEWVTRMAEYVGDHPELYRIYNKSKAEFAAARKAALDMQRHERAVDSVIKAYQELPAKKVTIAGTPEREVLQDEELKKQLLQTLVDMKKSGEKLSDAQLATMQRWVNEARISRMTGLEKISGALKEMVVNNLVSSPLSHMANITGNTAAILWRSMAVKPATVAIEKLVSKVKKVPSETEWREIPETMLSTHTALVESAKEFKKALLGQTDSESKWLESGNTKIVPGAAGKALRLPTHLLGVEDTFFKTFLRRQVVNELAIREAKKTLKPGQKLFDRVEEIKKDPPEWIKEEAEKEALDWTWQSPFNKDSKADPIVEKIMGVRNAMGPVGVLMLPFIKTPYMIFKFGLKSTPLGYFNAGRKFAAGKISKEQFAKEAALATTGSMLLSAVTANILNGNIQITGQAPKDKGVLRTFYSAGMMPYAIKTKDGNVIPISRLEPIASIVGVAADLAQSIKNNDVDSRWQRGDFWAAVGADIAKNFSSKIWLQNIAKFIDVLTSPEGAESKLKNLAGDYTTALIPGAGMLGAATRANDTYMREKLGFLDAIKSKLPIVSKTLEPKVDLTGQDVERPGVNWAVRFISPVQPGELTKNEVIKETGRVGASVTQPKKTITIAKPTYENFPKPPRTSPSNPGYAADQASYLRRLKSAVGSLIMSRKADSEGKKELTNRQYYELQKMAGQYYENMASKVLGVSMDKRNESKLTSDDAEKILKWRKDYKMANTNQEKADVLNSIGTWANTIARGEMMFKMAREEDPAQTKKLMVTAKEKPVLDL